MPGRWTSCETVLRVLGLMLLAAGAARGQSFVEQPLPGVPTGVEGTGGAASIDANGDGLADIYFPGRLYLNLGGRSFEERYEDAGFGSPAGAARSAWGDFDRDGFLDVLLQPATGPARLLRNGHNDAFTDAGAETLLAPLDGVTTAVWADFDVNSTLDLFAGSATDDPHYLVNIVGALLFDVAAFAGLTRPVAPCTAAAADYDRDGDPDLFLGTCRGDGSPNTFYRNEGLNVFTEIDVGLADAPTGTALWFDYDNDGWLDLYMDNDDAPNRLYRNDGAGGFTDVTGTAGVAGAGVGGSAGVAAEDFDNDGWTDLVVAGRDGAATLFFHNEGDGTFTDRILDTGLTQQALDALTAADYDGDGRVDLALSAEGVDRVFFNEGTAGNWLQVALRGVSSNTFGLGARVEVLAGGRVHSRVMSAGAGFRSQNMAYTVHFGLAEAERADEVRIRWPSGDEDVLTGVAVNRRLTVVEGEGEDAPPAAFHLLDPPDGSIQGQEPDIRFAWEPAPDPEGKPVTYTLAIRAPGVDTVLSAGEATSLVLDRDLLPNNERYEWTVTASDGRLVRRNTGRFGFQLILPRSFTDASDRLPFPGFPLGAPRRGGNAVDVNADGWVDLVFPDRLYLNRGGARFDEALEATGYERQLAQVPRMVWADYDDDGLLDVLMAFPELTLLQNHFGLLRPVDPDVRFPAVESDAPAWADFDLDGRLDLFLGAREGGVNLVVPYDGTFANGFQLATTMTPCGAAPADVDIDGDADLYLGVCEGDVGRRGDVFLRNDGAAGFTDLTVASGLGTQDAITDALWFDYDNDGDPDLYRVNQGRPNQLFRNDGAFTFVNVTATAGVAGRINGETNGHVVADFDNDGWLDLFLSGSPLRRPEFFRNRGDGTFVDLYDKVGLNLDEVHAATGADFDGDGWIDLAVVSPERDHLFLNNGGLNHWLTVGLRGRTANSYGVGARVEVSAGGLRQVREISIGNGLTSQNGNLTAHFGLGAAAVVDEVRVVWPGGAEDRLSGIPADQVLTVVEGLGANRAPEPFDLTTPVDGAIVRKEVQDVTFSWAPALDPEGDPVHYSLHFAGEGVDTVVTGLTATEWVIRRDRLPENAAYSWAVTASDGYSVRMAGRHTFVLGEPPVPELLLIPYALPNLRPGSADAADLDRDGDLHLLLTGTQDGLPVTRLLTLEDSLYTISINAFDITLAFKVYRRLTVPFPNLTGGTARWGDADGDGDLDVLLMGRADVDGGTLVTQRYTNTDRQFRLEGGDPFPGLLYGDAAWLDYDGDGDNDLLLSGATREAPPYAPVTRLFRNEGGAFVETGMAFPGLVFSDIAAADYDGDGDPDLALTGLSEVGFVTRIYRNDDGVFREAEASLPALAFGSVDWGDLEGDGDLDLLVAGGRLDPRLLHGVTRIYRNDGSGGFLPMDPGLVGLVLGEARWADYDGDGDDDVILTGVRTPLSEPEAWVYRNYRGETFFRDVNLGGLRFGLITTGDYNADGDLDVLLLGENADGTPVTNFLMNRLRPERLPPGLIRQ